VYPSWTPHEAAIIFSALIPAFPLGAAIVLALLGAKWFKKSSHVPAIIGVSLSFFIALKLLLMFQFGQLAAPNATYIQSDLWTWIGAGGFKASVGIFLDPLSCLFAAFVTGISLLIFIYSSGYMEGDYGYFRFFAYMSLFVFFMTTLVLANNFLLVYLGWEGVGLASYLLIGYYYPRPAARDAATKAFITNRVGDTCFAIAVLMIYLTFHSLKFSHVFYGSLQSPAFRAAHRTVLFWIPLLLMFGAFAKSAQFPLHVWLPDAMEGPTPVSALIHAATMVTAGVYLIARCLPLFLHDLPVLHLVGLIGCFTAFMAATIAMCQYDMKRIWAYSTISQLGYMFLGLGVATGTGAVFHVFTHAFFKALLFLATGSVMHAMGGELDIRKMSGLRKKMPITAICILMGCLALSGFPGWSGFFSKDDILSAAMNSTWRFGPWLAVVGLLTALITAYYTFRVFFRVFTGELILPATAGQHESSPFFPPGDLPGGEHAVNHGRPAAGDAAKDRHAPAKKPRSLDGAPAMWLPLIVLAIGATFAGYLGVFGSHAPGGWIGGFLGRVPLNGTIRYVPTPPAGLPQPVGGHVNPILIMIIGAALAVLGVLIAAYFHRINRQAAAKVAVVLRPLVHFLENKWYIDELYHYTLVRPLRFSGYILSLMDRFIVDGLVFVIGFIPQLAGFTIKPTESGRLRYYGIGMVAGVAVVLLGVLYLLR
jgi:NADH-quinone oxidoreductase subunit L